MKIMRKGACMRRKEITRYFLKELETFPVPYENISGMSDAESKEWIITCWDKSRVFVKLLCDGDVVPTEEEQTQLCTEYMCSKVAICRDIADMRQVLSPIHAEIYEKSGEKARREARRRAQQEKEEREHSAALARKAEKQKMAELRREKQLEKARLFHLSHDE